MRTFACLLIVFAMTICAAEATAAVITDGSLTLSVENNGTFNVISLNGTTIDSSSFFQEQYVSGSLFTPASPVVAAGPVATYSATIGSSFSISATSTILGPLASNPATTNVLEQRFVVTNTSRGTQTLDSISHVDQDLADNSGGDVVAFDTVQRAVFAQKSGGSQLVAAIADEGAGTLGWQVGNCCTPTTMFANLTNNLGPIGPGDTQMHIGLDAGTLLPGNSRTLTFRYLFSTNLESVPGDFVIPEPTALVLVASGLLGSAGLVGRRRWGVA